MLGELTESRPRLSAENVSQALKMLKWIIFVFFLIFGQLINDVLDILQGKHKVRRAQYRIFCHVTFVIGIMMLINMYPPAQAWAQAIIEAIINASETPAPESMGTSLGTNISFFLSANLAGRGLANLTNQAWNIVYTSNWGLHPAARGLLKHSYRNLYFIPTPDYIKNAEIAFVKWLESRIDPYRETLIEALKLAVETPHKRTESLNRIILQLFPDVTDQDQLWEKVKETTNFTLEQRITKNPSVMRTWLVKTSGNNASSHTFVSFLGMNQQSIQKFLVGLLEELVGEYFIRKQREDRSARARTRIEDPYSRDIISAEKVKDYITWIWELQNMEPAMSFYLNKERKLKNLLREEKQLAISVRELKNGKNIVKIVHLVECFAAQNGLLSLPQQKQVELFLKQVDRNIQGLTKKLEGVQQTHAELIENNQALASGRMPVDRKDYSESVELGMISFDVRDRFQLAIKRWQENPPSENIQEGILDAIANKTINEIFSRQPTSPIPPTRLNSLLPGLETATPGARSW